LLVLKMVLTLTLQYSPSNFRNCCEVVDEIYVIIIY
jgi:hypothetical protein